MFLSPSPKTGIIRHNIRIFKGFAFVVCMYLKADVISQSPLFGDVLKVSAIVSSTLVRTTVDPVQ